MRSGAECCYAYVIIVMCVCVCVCVCVFIKHRLVVLSITFGGNSMGAFGSVQRASGKSSLSNELILLATIHDMYSILAHCKHLFRSGLLEIYPNLVSRFNIGLMEG